MNLFDPDSGYVRWRDPDTSHAAALSVNAAHVEGMILDVFSGLALTDDELCARLPHLHAPTVKTARSRLTHRAVLIDTGLRRPSNRGRAQIVWRTA